VCKAADRADLTGSKHADENLADVLKRRPAELPLLIEMSDALSRNAPRHRDAAGSMPRSRSVTVCRNVSTGPDYWSLFCWRWQLSKAEILRGVDSALADLMLDGFR